jgi:hypothetical protein
VSAAYSGVGAAYSGVGAAYSGVAAAASVTAAAAASASGKLYAGCAGILFVEDIKRRQADVRDFLLTESDFVTHSGVLRRYIRCRPTGCGGCAARQRQ